MFRNLISNPSTRIHLRHMIELEAKLSASESARVASQTRIENLVTKLDKTVQQIQVSAGNGDGVGAVLQRSKDAAAAATAATAAVEKMRSGLFKAEKRVADLEHELQELQGQVCDSKLLSVLSVFCFQYCTRDGPHDG